MSYSSSGFDNGFRTLAFDKEGYRSKTATYSEAIISEDGEIAGMNYFVNNNKTTKEEFDKAYEAYNQKAYTIFEEIRLDKYTFE